jgi:hypothetical protein
MNKNALSIPTNGDSQPVTRRECDNRFSQLEGWVRAVDERVRSIDNRFWGIMIAAVFLLAGIIVDIVISFGS